MIFPETFMQKGWYKYLILRGFRKEKKKNLQNSEGKLMRDMEKNLRAKNGYAYDQTILNACKQFNLKFDMLGNVS